MNTQFHSTRHRTARAVAAPALQHPQKKAMASLFFAAAGIALLAASLAASGANAQSAQEKADQLQQEIHLTEAAKSTDAKCGTKIATEVDWKAFEKGKWREKNYSLYSYCASALEALEALCVGPKSKDYVKANVKKFRCTLAAPGKRALSVKSKTILFAMDPTASNNSDWARAETLGAL